MKPNNTEFLQAITEVANKIQGAEKLAVPLLAVRASKAAQENPYDQSLRVLASTLSKMADNGKILITKAEFNDVFSKTSTGLGSVAANYFSDELNKEAVKPQRELAGSDEKVYIESDELYSVANKAVGNALTGLWDNTGKPSKEGSERYFDPQMAKQAQTATSLTLARIGCNTDKITTFAGSENFIICDAAYATSKGEVHTLVPVEISKSGALIPNMFLSRHGFADLAKDNLVQHIKECAGNSFTVNASQLLNALNSIKKVSSLDEFELRALAAQESVDKKGMVKQAGVKTNYQFEQNFLLSQVDSADAGEVKLPKHEDTDKFASKLSSVAGAAEFVFGKKTVDAGRDFIISKMASFGYDSNVKVSNADDDSITYAVAVNAGGGKFGFEVIASVSNGKINVPSIAVVADKAFDFNKDGIHSMISQRASDNKAVAVVSPLYDLSTNEVVDLIRNAADKGDFKVAEDALNVLSEKADERVYMVALAEYMRSLNGSNKGLNKEASEKKCGCSKVIKVSSHSVPVCGHLNMPLDQVYQNEHGECVPKYRKNLESGYENVLFNTSKTFIF